MRLPWAHAHYEGYDLLAMQQVSHKDNNAVVLLDCTSMAWLQELSLPKATGDTAKVVQLLFQPFAIKSGISTGALAAVTCSAEAGAHLVMWTPLTASYSSSITHRWECVACVSLQQLQIKLECAVVLAWTPQGSLLVAQQVLCASLNSSVGTTQCSNVSDCLVQLTFVSFTSKLTAQSLVHRGRNITAFTDFKRLGQHKADRCSSYFRRSLCSCRSRLDELY
jgi:hypothetical protein